MKKFEKIFERTAIVAMTLLFPMMALAATIETGLDKVKGILNLVIGILFVLVTLWFIWGIVQYVMAGGDETKIKLGKDHMIWGIIGMAVMAGAWGLVNVVLTTFGVGSENIPPGPRQF
ncbi:pilin [Patescibacteria group bacterium]|nr:pilin [Patescibacteria group bacterium]